MQVEVLEGVISFEGRDYTAGAEVDLPKKAATSLAKAGQVRLIKTESVSVLETESKEA